MIARDAIRPRREVVSTIREDGSRRFIFPADVRGPFTRWRGRSALVLIAVYALLPWIRVGGYPAVFLDVAARRFHLFGLTLAVQDLWLMFFLITGVGFGLFVATALFGRVWCGWGCPQTVFLDHVYRRIERWADGDAVERRMLAAAPWTARKLARRCAKHGAYLLCSLGIAHLFLAYFVSLPALWSMMTQAPLRHWADFAFVAAATAAVNFNFAWFREQLCVVICPYGRLQSALTDDHSLVIGYDERRGEPRGPAGSAVAGDCVDCERCVRVCPTGIDIRQGLQLECIGCAACVDACDEVMRRLGRAPGLVRYDSVAGLAGRERRWWRPRLAVYAVLMTAGAAAAAAALLTVRPLLVGASRLVGAPYYVDGGVVRDQFLVRLTNKRNRPVSVRLEPVGLPAGASIRGAEAPVELGPLAEEFRPIIVEMPAGRLAGPFPFGLRAAEAGGPTVNTPTLEFLGPSVGGGGP